jgi:hypothetical protein
LVVSITALAEIISFARHPRRQNLLTALRHAKLICLLTEEGIHWTVYVATASNQ